MLEDVSEIEAETLAIQVENGCIVLAGSVTNRTELKRIVRLLSNIRGVRDIKTLAVVSPMQKMRDRIIEGSSNEHSKDPCQVEP
jgi:hypothetical protein